MGLTLVLGSYEFRTHALPVIAGISPHFSSSVEESVPVILGGHFVLTLQFQSLPSSHPLSPSLSYFVTPPPTRPLPALLSLSLSPSLLQEGPPGVAHGEVVPGDGAGPEQLGMVDAAGAGRAPGLAPHSPGNADAPARRGSRSGRERQPDALGKRPAFSTLNRIYLRLRSCRAHEDDTENGR